MKQLIKTIKGLYTAADENDISLEYATTFHNCKVNQNYIESVRYKAEVINNDNIAEGICYLSDSLKNEYNYENDELEFIYDEEFDKYEYKIFKSDTAYVLHLHKDTIYVINLATLDDELKEIVNTKGRLNIYFKHSVVVISKVKRYKRNKRGVTYYSAIYPLNIQKYKLEYKEKVITDCKLVNKSLDANNRTVRFAFQEEVERPTGNQTGFLNRIIFNVLNNDTLLECKSRELTYFGYAGEVPVYIKLHTPSYPYELYTLRRVEVRNGKNYLTDFLIPYEYFSSYFEDKLSNNSDVEIINSKDTLIYVFGRIKSGNLVYNSKVKISAENKFVLLKVKEECKFEVPNINNIGFTHLQPSDILANNEPYFVYKPFNIEQIGIEKPGLKHAELITTMVVENSDEVFLRSDKVEIIGSPANKFGIEVKNTVLTDEDWYYNDFPQVTKFRYYLKFDSEEPELVWELDFYDRKKLNSKDFLITKRELTGITLLNNTGLVYEDFNKGFIIPDKVEKVNNLLIGYKNGEIYLPAYGNGRFQDLLYYKSRIVENIKDKIIAYSELNKNLIIFTKNYSEMFIIQSDKAGDIILVPIQDSVPVGIENKFQISKSSDKFFILFNKGIIVYSGNQSKLISTQIQNIIESRYKELAIHYDEYNKQLLVFDFDNEICYIYDDFTETWFSIDVPSKYRINDLKAIKNEGSIVLLGFGNKVLLLRFNEGIQRNSRIVFPKTSFDEYKLLKYITEVIVATDNNTEIKLKLNGNTVNLVNGEYRKYLVPFKDRVPSNRLNMELEFKGRINTIQYNLELAGESLIGG